MLIFIDHRSSKRAKEKLSKFGSVIEFITYNIVEDYICGHPDLFICKTPTKLITAPNLPEKYFSILDNHNIQYNIGSSPVTKNYPNCAIYNCVINEKFKIHKNNISDISLNSLDQIPIEVKQGMTRCSLLSLDSQNYITSDQGITNILTSKGLNVCYVNPKEIKLPGKEYGLIGGTAGVNDGKVFFNGSLEKFSEGEKIKRFIGDCGFQIIELDDSPLYDGGGILFV